MSTPENPEQSTVEQESTDDPEKIMREHFEHLGRIFTGAGVPAGTILMVGILPARERCSNPDNTGDADSTGESSQN